MNSRFFDIGLPYEQGEQIRPSVGCGLNSEARCGVDQRGLTSDQARVLAILDVVQPGAFPVDVTQEGLDDLLSGIAQRLLVAPNREKLAPADEVGNLAVLALEPEWTSSTVVGTEVFMEAALLGKIKLVRTDWRTHLSS